jgi:hypothetical protein
MSAATHNGEAPTVVLVHGAFAEPDAVTQVILTALSAVGSVAAAA